MNHCARTPRLAPCVLLALFLTAFLAACGGSTQPTNETAAGPSSEAPPLQGTRIGGRFTLTNQDGRRVSDSDFSGKYRLIYMGFANCPDVCPVDLQVMGEGLRRFERQDPARGGRVQPIFITVDPDRDTPEVLRSYVRNFHARLVGLTGTREETDAVVRAHGGSAIKGETSAGGGYNVNHSRYILLMGPQGEPIAIVPHETPEGVAAELDKWVR